VFQEAEAKATPLKLTIPELPCKRLKFKAFDKELKFSCGVKSEGRLHKKRGIRLVCSSSDLPVPTHLLARGGITPPDSKAKSILTIITR